MPKTLEGYVGDGAGLPLDAIAATVKKVADGATVATGATDPAGRWRFTGLPATDEYFVTLADGAGRAVVRGPWSGELREAWVRDRLDMPATAVAVLPGGANAFLGTLAFDPPTGAGALDARYVNTTGDTMTGALAVPSLTVGGNDLSQATLDARYVNTAGDAMSGTLTLPALSVAGNDISYSSLDTRYVNTTGDAMTGALAVPSLTVAGVAINQTTLDARYVNTAGDAMTGPLSVAGQLDATSLYVAGGLLQAGGTAVAMTGTLAVNGLAVAASPDASNALEWRANGFYATAGSGGGGPSGTNVAAWVTRVANQAVGNATDTAVSFDTEVRDDGGYWTSGAPTRITIPTTGWYGFAGWIIFEANTAGIRYLHLRKGGTDFLATTSSGPHAADGSARLTVAMNLYLVAGDYIEMLVFHNRGASTSLNVAGALSVVGLGAAAPTGAPTTAPYITTAPDAGLSNEVLLASVIGYGTNAAMPAFGTAGRLYYDTTNSLLMRDSGSAWQSVEGAGGGGGLTKAQADTYYEPLDSAYTKAEADARYEPIDTMYTKAEADARYPQKTDLDPYPQYLTQTEGDARYTQGGITQAAADLRYEPLDSAYTKAEDDARFVNLAGGSVMTGLLGPTTTNTRDLGTTALRWRKLWSVDGEFTNVPTVGGVALLTQAAADLRYEPIDTMYTKAESDARYTQGGITQAAADLRYEPLDSAYTKAEDDARFVQLSGGSVMTGLFGPTTTNTRDLGTSTLRWRKLWGVDADLSGVLGVTGVTTPTGGLAGSPVVINKLTDPAFLAGYTATPGLLVQHEGVDRNGLSLARASSADNTSEQINFWRARGTWASKAAVASGDNISQIVNWAWSGTQWLPTSWIESNIVGAVTTTAVPTSMSFVTSNSAGTTANRLNIGSDGVVHATAALQVNSRPVVMAGCRVRHSAAQVVTTAVALVLAFNSERYDTDNFHDLVTNNSRLTVPTGLAGKYHIWVAVEWAPIADTTYRLLGLQLNGTTAIGRTAGPNTNNASFAMNQNVSVVYDLAAGDYVEAIVFQASAGNLNLNASANYSPEFGMHRIG